MSRIKGVNCSSISVTRSGDLLDFGHKLFPPLKLDVMGWGGGTIRTHLTSFKNGVEVVEITSTFEKTFLIIKMGHLSPLF